MVYIYNIHSVLVSHIPIFTPNIGGRFPNLEHRSPLEPPQNRADVVMQFAMTFFSASLMDQNLNQDHQSHHPAIDISNPRM